MSFREALAAARDRESGLSERIMPKGSKKTDGPEWDESSIEFSSGAPFDDDESFALSDDHDDGDGDDHEDDDEEEAEEAEEAEGENEAAGIDTKMRGDAENGAVDVTTDGVCGDGYRGGESDTGDGNEPTRAAVNPFLSAAGRADFPAPRGPHLQHTPERRPPSEGARHEPFVPDHFAYRPGVGQRRRTSPKAAFAAATAAAVAIAGAAESSLTVADGMVEMVEFLAAADLTRTRSVTAGTMLRRDRDARRASAPDAVLERTTSDATDGQRAAERPTRRMPGRVERNAAVAGALASGFAHASPRDFLRRLGMPRQSGDDGGGASDGRASAGRASDGGASDGGASDDASAEARAHALAEARAAARAAAAEALEDERQILELEAEALALSTTDDDSGEGTRDASDDDGSSQAALGFLGENEGLSRSRMSFTVAVHVGTRVHRVSVHGHHTVGWLLSEIMRRHDGGASDEDSKRDPSAEARDATTAPAPVVTGLIVPGSWKPLDLGDDVLDVIVEHLQPPRPGAGEGADPECVLTAVLADAAGGDAVGTRLGGVKPSVVPDGTDDGTADGFTPPGRVPAPRRAEAAEPPAPAPGDGLPGCKGLPRSRTRRLREAEASVAVLRREVEHLRGAAAARCDGGSPPPGAPRDLRVSPVIVQKRPSRTLEDALEEAARAEAAAEAAAVEGRRRAARVQAKRERKRLREAAKQQRELRRQVAVLQGRLRTAPRPRAPAAREFGISAARAAGPRAGSAAPEGPFAAARAAEAVGRPSTRSDRADRETDARALSPLDGSRPPRPRRGRINRSKYMEDLADLRATAQFKESGDFEKMWARAVRHRDDASAVAHIARMAGGLGLARTPDATPPRPSDERVPAAARDRRRPAAAASASRSAREAALGRASSAASDVAGRSASSRFASWSSAAPFSDEGDVSRASSMASFSELGGVGEWMVA
jgi:hypothetical protein